MVKRAVITNFGRFTNHYAHTVVDEKTTTDFGTGVDLDTGNPAGDSGNKFGQPFPVFAPQEMVDTMQLHRMDTGISSDNLKYVTRSRITFKNAVDVFLDTLPAANFFTHLFSSL